MNKPKKTPKIYSQDAVENAVARLIASTRRKRRQLKLLEIANDLEIALSAYKSLSKVADVIDISSEMLRQFSRVNKLCLPVKQLIADGIIQSVDIADRLSRLPVADQLPVARAVAQGSLTSDDVRAIVSLRKALPKEEIGKVVDRVKKSRSIKQYVVEFLIPAHKKEKEIKEAFIKVFGKESVVAFGSRVGISHAILNATGKHRVDDIAKKEGLTKRALIDKIISGALT